MCNWDIVVSGLFSLIGVVIGFFLNYYYESHKSKKYYDNIRSLFKYELHQNKKVLIKLRNQINGMDGEEVSFNRSVDVIMLVWNKWNVEIPSVFNKDEISYLLKVYNNLEEIMDDKNWVQSDSEECSKFVERDYDVQHMFDLVKNKKKYVLNKTNELLKLMESNSI